MIKRGQVLVRAIDGFGKWGNCDVMDLDEDSFKAFVIDVFFRHNLLVGLKVEYCDGEEIVLTSKYPFTKE